MTAFIVIISLVAAWVLISQSIHVFKYGNAIPFFLGESKKSKHKSAARGRFAGALVYAIPGLAIFLIWANELRRFGIAQFWGWLRDHRGGLFNAALILTLGLWALLVPDYFVKGAMAANPGYDLDKLPFLRNFIRGVGLFMAVFGFIILANL